MWLLSESENEISSGKIRNLFTFSLQYDILAVGHTLFNFYSHFGVVHYETPGFTLSTLSRHRLSFSAALVTMGLHLHLHSKSYLYVLEYDTSSLAPGACFQFPIFCSCSSTFITVHITTNCKGPPSTQIQVFKSHSYISPRIRAFLSGWLPPKKQK